jgi:hypothetical protein
MHSTHGVWQRKKDTSSFQVQVGIRDSKLKQAMFLHLP